MFKKRSSEKELMDDVNLDKDEFFQNLRELSVINRWLGSQALLINALNRIKHQFPHYFKKNLISIADLCCGGGDMLASIKKWSIKNNINIDLFGIDISPLAIEYAESHTQKDEHLKFLVKDILTIQNDEAIYDITCINSSLHHFDNTEIEEILFKLLKITRLAIVINDLHRHIIPYYSIQLMTKAFNYSNYAKNDGPVSVLRAFKRNELQQLIRQTTNHNFEICWRWPFRWQVIIWCNNDKNLREQI